MDDNQVPARTSESAHTDEPTPTEPTAAAVLDAHGTVTAWNGAASELLGYRLNEVLGRPARELLSGPLPEAVRGRMAAHQEWTARAAVRTRRDGAVRLDLTGSPLTGARSSIRWLVQAVPAAPDADAADATVPAGEADFGSRSMLKEWALDQLALPVAVCDGRLRVVAANRQMTALTGCDEDELLSRGIESMVPHTAEVTGGVAHLAKQVLRTGSTAHHTVRTPDGAEVEERIWSMHLAPLRSADRRIRALSVSFTDVTQQALAKRRLALVNDAGERIGQTLDVAETARELAEVGVGFADFVTVDLLDSVIDGGELRPSLPHGRPLVFRRVADRSVLPGNPESVMAPGAAHAHPEDSPPGLALRRGRPFRHETGDPEVRRWLRQSPARAETARKHGIHSLMGVPLIARGTALGIVQFFRHRTHQPFDEDDLLLAQEIGARAAVCVDNARRYTRERSAALTLQRSLLPRLSGGHPAVDVACRYLPANASVGGDWFDVIPLSGARIALVVGDVVGHGVSAAATMGRLSTAVRTLADMELPPEELLTRLDDLVITLHREHGHEEDSHITGDVGSTCLYAVYDPLTAVCSMARAGHPPPAVATPDGTVDFPDLPSGPPLGVGGLPFESVDLPVPDGTVLAFYTNGVIRTADENLTVGLHVLRDNLHHHTGSLEQTCDRIVASTLADRPPDDLAVLLARTRTLDRTQVATWELSADAEAVAEARRRTGHQLADWGLRSSACATELIVSELVTNAIRYGSEPLRLRLIRDSSLTCEVADGNETAPHVRRARAYDEGGRGLLIVAQLADRWGSRHTDDGKVIWAEQFLGPQSADKG